MIRDRHAKIVATVGPASASPFMLRNLYNMGVDTFRLNFSHGAHDIHATTIAAIRGLEAEVGSPIGILQDLQGPKIRLGLIAGGVRMLERRDTVCFEPAETVADPNCLPLPHPEIFVSINIGDRLFIDDGRVRLRVTQAAPDRITAEVIEGGKISDRKGVNLPDCVLDLPVLTDKDRRDLEFGLAHGVDWVALSFVQSADDLREIRDIIGDRAGLVSKIEKPSALDDIDRIVEQSDAIMIARGDLGVEIPPEDVPAYQKEIIALCRRKCRPVIVATQMLESMTQSPAPTRAEASDVATAIYDGADAVMLSAESATGAYPAETVKVMSRIIASTEKHRLYVQSIQASREPAETDADAIADTGTVLARALGARCIVAYSISGMTAIRAAARRPHLPLIVLTSSQTVARQIALVWGVRPVQVEVEKDSVCIIETARVACKSILTGTKDDKMVLMSGNPFGRVGSTNNIRVISME